VGDMLDTRLTLVIGGATSAIARAVISELADEYRIVPLVRSKVCQDFFGGAPVKPIEVDYFSDEPFDLKGAISNDAKIIFVNFAASKEDRIFLNQTMDNFIETYKVNVLTNISPLQSLIPKMISAKWGRIIFVSSSGAARGDVGISSYAASKSALLGLSGSLSKEYGKFGITANVFSLGYFDSELMRKVPEKKLNALMSGIPGRKIGSGRDIAAAIRMLVETDYINGSVIKLDGGG
jgi:NAD(P)-dependent dehydrogenase (short-subunit alcohol dehydrogenase family)